MVVSKNILNDRYEAIWSNTVDAVTQQKFMCAILPYIRKIQKKNGWKQRQIKKKLVST